MSAADRFANPVPCRNATLRADGVGVPLDLTPDGDASAVLRVPEKFDGRESVVVEAALAAARAHAESLLSRAPPARLTVAVATPPLVADAPRAGGPRVGLMQDQRPPIPAATPVAGGTARGTRTDIDQSPIGAIARNHLPWRAADIHLRAGLGLSLAGTRLAPPPQDGPPALAGAYALAAQGGPQAGFPPSPRQLVAGVRYLCIEIGRPSHHADIPGH